MPDPFYPGWQDTTGSWTANLRLFPGAHTLSAQATHPSGWTTPPTLSAFAVTGVPETFTQTFDAAGNVLTRTWSGGKIQTFTWDAFGQLVKVVQTGVEPSTWTACYDALGRRLQTSSAPTSTLPATPTVVRSIFDPQAEFLEIGVAVGGLQQWKVFGPDLHGGSLNGTGGLEWVITPNGNFGAINDAFGNVVASVTSNTTVTWSPVKVGGYGPLPGTDAQTLEAGASVLEALAWRTRRIDPTGFINLGARHYDPERGIFLSCDPLGHVASVSLYDYASGDPINNLDPDGRFGKGISSGWSGSVSSSSPSSGAFNAGLMLGGMFSGGAQGFQGGASITANTLSFGGSDYAGWTNSGQYQGSEYTFSRISSTIARESLITAATLGTAQMARAGSQGSLYAYQGLQTFNTARSGYNIGEGALRVGDGDSGGWIQIGAGTLGVAGSISYAATNPTLNSIAGVSSSSGGFAQPMVNWINQGSQADAAFRSLSIPNQIRSEVGMKALSDTQFGAVSALDPVARGSTLMGNNSLGALFSINPKQILNLMGTGPSPAVRVYLPGGMMIGSGAGNAADVGR